MQLIDPTTDQEPSLLKNPPLKSGGYMLRLFGPMTLEGGDRHQTKFPTKRSALLLACLAVARGQRIGRDELAEMLWPDDYLDLTRIRLRQELRRLRTAVEGFGCCLRSDRQWVEIEPGCLTTDVQAFDEAVVSAAVALDEQSKVEYLTKAVSLLNGPFLAGHQEPWVHATRRTYNEKARRAWLALGDAFQALGSHEKALDATINAVRHDPLDTDANTVLIRRLVDRGQGARARQAFLEFDAMMFRELGTHAPPSTRMPLASTSSDKDDVTLVVDSGQRTHVTRPLPIVGRDELLEAVQSSLSRPGACVALVGMVGVGKTHVIRESAWRFSQANDLPVQFGGFPERVSDGLFIIDQNIESENTLALMAAASQAGWRVLAESRLRLDSNGIEEILVPPLPTPMLGDDCTQVYANPSVQLLMSKVAEHGIGKSNPSECLHLAELARQLDGLPSALKVFASRLMVETPEQLIRNINAGLAEYISSQNSAGESIRSAIDLIISELPIHHRDALVSLSLLDGVSVDVAARITAPHDSAEVWRALERRSLITVQGRGTGRRLRVPNPISHAIDAIVDRNILAVITENTWHTLADWAFEQSRKQTGPNQDEAFSNVMAEFTNLKRGLKWGIQHNPGLAAYLTVATWRTVCARGNPSVEGDLLYLAAKVGASSLHPDFGGEAWNGAAITLSTMGRLEDAEHAYHEAMKIYEASNNPACVGWAKLNYSVHVLAHTDKQRAVENLKSIADEAASPDLRILALSDYALVLASTGVIGESIGVAEEVFAARLQSSDITTHGRAYADLGELYQVAGRPEAARPLLVEGIRRLRDAGIQNMLVDQLIFLARISLNDEVVEWASVESLLEEARSIALRVGTSMKLLDIACVRMTYASRIGDRVALLAAIEEVFQLTRSSESSKERERSLRILATELGRHGKHDYANAVTLALGDPICGPYHLGWNALMSTDSHATICVLAVVLAKEALFS